MLSAVSPPLYSIGLETVVGGVKKVFEARTEGTKRRKTKNRMGKVHKRLQKRRGKVCTN